LPKRKEKKKTIDFFSFFFFHKKREGERKEENLLGLSRMIGAFSLMSPFSLRSVIISTKGNEREKEKREFADLTKNDFGFFRRNFGGVYSAELLLMLQWNSKLSCVRVHLPLVGDLFFSCSTTSSSFSDPFSIASAMLSIGVPSSAAALWRHSIELLQSQSLLPKFLFSFLNFHLRIGNFFTRSSLHWQWSRTFLALSC
jgi:hypothetical protein